MQQKLKIFESKKSKSDFLGNKKLLLIIGLIVIVVMMQGKKQGSIIQPPVGYAGCNVLYRSNYQVWTDPGRTGSTTTSWVYYNGETYSGSVVGTCSVVEEPDMVHILGGIYHNPSTDKVIWKGTDQNNQIKCNSFSNDNRLDDIIETSNCHTPYEVWYGNPEQNWGIYYDDLVFCNNDGTIGECLPSEIDYNQFLSYKNSYLSGSSLDNFINNANLWINA